MRETEGELLKGFGEDDNENLIGQKKVKRRFLLISIISIIVVLIIIYLIIFLTKKNNSEQNDDNDDPTELDTIPKEEFEKARNSFKQFNFTDSVNSSKILFYNLFIPENYNKTQNIKYPLIMFIGDASTVGTETTYPLSQTVGGPIWATDTIQKKHKCFVLVPQYNEIIIDDNKGYTKSEYINVTTRLISKLQNEYNIDPNLIYGTGQSMGAMTNLYLLANYPNLLTAGLIVDGQWIKEELLGLVNSTFTYFAAGGDMKAFNGQNETKNYLDSLNISYGCLTDLNAKEKVEILNNASKEMYASGKQYNFITYTKGSVLPSNSKDANEHMSSFKYGYRIETVRDWIFQQNKIKCEEGLFYSQDGKCSSTNFCYKTKADNSCSECIYGYHLSTDRSSCTNDINCKTGDKKTGFCSWCKDDFYLDIKDNKCKSNLDDKNLKYCKIADGNVCIQCDNFYYLAQDKKCSISANCSITNDSLCAKCIDGYYLGLDYKCTNVEKCIYSSNNQCTECQDGFYYDMHDYLCKEMKDNFMHCKRNAEYDQNQCFVCKYDYYLSQLDYLCYDNTQPGPFYKCQKSNFYGTFCMFCVEDYYIGNIDLNCSKIQGCLMSLNEDTCLKCERYYCLDNVGNCTDNSYVIDEDKKYYYRCKMLNEDGNKCEICEHSLNTTDDGICYDDYHCIKDEFGECMKCEGENPYGYPTYCLNKVFGCIDSFLEHCIRCDDIFELDVCTECEEGYEIDEYGECVEIEQYNLNK